MQVQLDQRENDRREREAHRISALPLDKQQAETEKELILQSIYNTRTQSMIKTNMTTWLGYLVS
jgi:hypothetical protein